MSSQSRRPPGPKGRFLSGNLQQYESDRLGFLLDARDRYGGLVSFDARTTIVNDPQLARELLKSRDVRIRESFLQKRLDAAGMEQALEMRRLLSPTLRRNQAAGVMPIAHRHMAHVLEGLGRNGRDVWSPLADLEVVTSRSIAEYYFSTDWRELPEAVGELLDALSVVIGNPFAAPEWWPAPSRLRIGRSHRRLQAIVIDLLERRLHATERFDDRATDLVIAGGGGRHLELSRIADLLIGALLAAHRVPAAACGWALMLAAERPGLQHELRAEARQLEAALARTSGTVAASEYSCALSVVLETLRLFPATWMVSRFATRPVEVGGYDFPPGHNFLISPYVIHRDDASFRNANSFNIARWRRHATATQTFIPFGHGLNACPGRDLAVNLLVALLLTATHRLELGLAGRPAIPDAHTTLLPRGLALRIT